MLPAERPEIRALFLDIDGTTLTSTRLIHPEALKCLRIIKKKGVPVIFASSRSPRGMIPILAEVGGEGHFIGFSGALIGYYRPEKIDFRFSRCMSVPSASSIANKAIRENIAVGWYSRDRWYVTDKNHEAVCREALITGETPVEVCSFSKLEDAPLKLLCMGRQDQINTLRNMQNSLPQDCIGEFSKSTYLEIMDGKVSKGFAVEKVCEELRVNLGDAMAVGDGENDIEMLRRVGLGVAMGNAAESVKAVADWVTGTNDEGGLGDALHLFFDCALE